MKILSHRGQWLDDAEKNSPQAFRRSFLSGFGTETDIRDYRGRLVVSHDIPGPDAMPIEELFEIHLSIAPELPLALNIKADGLCNEIQRLTTEYQIRNFFVFDMAVPDAMSYCEAEIVTYTRHSEYEPSPAFYELASGVWLDELKAPWICDEVIAQHAKNQKDICIVSPELHKREPFSAWSDYKRIEAETGISNLAICTDYPERARRFFNA